MPEIFKHFGTKQHKHMNTRTLVFIAFGIWSVICWRWYVCGIKAACLSTPVAANKLNAKPIPIDSSLLTPAPKPIEEPKTALTEPAPSPQTYATPSHVSVEKTYVIETKNRAEIHFPYNSTEKEHNAEMDEYLDRLADRLKSDGSTVTIAGHTDGIGDAKTNKAFSERRAKNIRDVLLAKGVPRSQIKCEWYGEEKRIASDDTPEGRYKNRRVVLTIGN